jgi:hypothetical protein
MFAFETEVFRCEQLGPVRPEKAVPPEKTRKKKRAQSIELRSLFSEEANGVKTLAKPAVTPPWQPPPVLESAFSVHPVE